MSDNCLFCKIAAGEIPSTRVYSDEEFYAFRDINPQAPTHVLVVPRRHIPTVASATASDADLLGRLILCANGIAEREGLTAGGFRYVINNGEGAGQTVFHIHLHLLGGRPMTWPSG